MIVQSGLDVNGNECSFYLDDNLKIALDTAKDRVKKDWDFCSCCVGTSGAGKSSFIRAVAKFCDPDFTHKNIAFTSEQFIEITNSCPKFSAVVLDEAFLSMNSRQTMSKDFQIIINHLQLIRQKNLFIFILLPNFFDLSKNVAIFRTSHLYLVYADDDGKRGKFLVFGRNEKRLLYIKGSKIIDVEAYEKAKMEHLQQQNKFLRKNTIKDEFKDLVVKLIDNKILSSKQIAELIGKSQNSIQKYAQRHRELQEFDVKM